MTGEDDGQGISGHNPTDGTGGCGLTSTAGKLPVSNSLTIRDSAQSVIDLRRKSLPAGEIDVYRKRLQLAVKIFLQLCSGQQQLRIARFLLDTFILSPR